MLLFDPGHLIGEGPSDDLRATLAVQTGAGPSVQQEVAVEIGALRPEGNALSLPLSWEATGWQRLFPEFRGELEVSPYGSGCSLRLHGSYHVPLGPLGRFGDGIAGRRLARQSLSAFLAQAARRIDAEVDGRADSHPWYPDRYPVAVRELALSENYLG